MNGNKRIDNPRMKIVKCVDAEAHVTPYLWAGNPCITPSNTVVYLIKCVCTSHVSLVGFLRNVIYVSVASEFGYRCLFFSIVWLSRRHTWRFYTPIAANLIATDRCGHTWRCFSLTVTMWHFSLDPRFHQVTFNNLLHSSPPLFLFAFISQTTRNLNLFWWYRVAFAGEMYKVLKRMCWTIVLSIKCFFFPPCPRCRRRRSLLIKVPKLILI